VAEKPVRRRRRVKLRDVSSFPLPLWERVGEGEKESMTIAHLNMN